MEKRAELKSYRKWLRNSKAQLEKLSGPGGDPRAIAAYERIILDCKQNIGRLLIEAGWNSLNAAERLAARELAKEAR